MARKREQNLFDDAFELLKLTPAWIGPLSAVLVFLLFYSLPSLITLGASQEMAAVTKPLFHLIACIAGAAILFAWIAAEFHKLLNRRLLDRQTGQESIRALSWQSFEQLVCEAFRRQGYLAEVVGTAHGDGGVDVKLTRSGEIVLVQCKQWRAYRVGVPTIREMLGLVVHHGANRGIVVTSGRFTNEANRFANQNPQIELIDGRRLHSLIREVQQASNKQDDMATRNPVAVTDAPRSCPSCGSEMVIRQARRGTHAGGNFYGCIRFPSCRGTRPYP